MLHLWNIWPTLKMCVSILFPKHFSAQYNWKLPWILLRVDSQTIGFDGTHLLWNSQWNQSVPGKSKVKYSTKYSGQGTMCNGLIRRYICLLSPEEFIHTYSLLSPNIIQRFFCGCRRKVYWVKELLCSTLLLVCSSQQWIWSGGPPHVTIMS